MLRNMLAKKNLREIILKIFSYSLGFLAAQDKPHKKSGCKNDLKSRDLKKIGAEAQEDFRLLTQQVCADSFLAKLRPVSQIHRPLFREGCSKNGPKMMFLPLQPQSSGLLSNMYIFLHPPVNIVTLQFFFMFKLNESLS